MMRGLIRPTKFLQSRIHSFPRLLRNNGRVFSNIHLSLAPLHDYKIISMINNLDLRNRTIDLPFYEPVLSKHIDKLDVDTIVRTVYECPIFKKKFILHVVDRNEIDLLCEVIEQSDEIILAMLDKNVEHIFVSFLCKNLDKFTPKIIDVIVSNKIFCDFFVNNIALNIGIMMKLSSSTRIFMMKTLSENIKKKLLRYFVENLKFVANELISDALQVNSTFVEEISKCVIAQKYLDFIRYLKSRDIYILLLNPNSLDLWREYIVNNLSVMLFLNKKFLELIIMTSDKIFRCKMIDIMHENDIVFISSVLYNSPRTYKKKLEELCLKHRNKLSLDDLGLIGDECHLSFVKKLIRKFLKGNKYLEVDLLINRLELRDFAGTNKLKRESYRYRNRNL